MTQLLVSVRSAKEALTALQGGASLIDVKEPERGALGRADDHVLRGVVEAVAGRRPISAALGEWADHAGTMPNRGLAFVKFGLAGCERRPEWRAAMKQLLLQSSAPQIVLVAYADWQCAQAPPIDAVFALAFEHPGCVVLVDTHCKEANNVVRKQKPTLLDWLPRAEIEAWCARCKEADVKIALAGSLGAAEIEELLPARPDWFAVRGAACDAGDRRAGVCVEKVRRLVDMVASSAGAQIEPAHV